MKPMYLTLFGALTLATTGCVGEFNTGNPGPVDQPPVEAPGVDAGVDPDPDPTELSTAQALFEANVRPLVGATCSPGGACHSLQDPAFVTADPLSSYDAINLHRDRLYPGYASEGASLLENGSGGHYAALFSTEDVAAIEAWLAQEALEADAGGGGQTASALAVWSGCMELLDWDAENVAQEWSNKQANNQGNCEACHNLGADGFIASDQSQRVFDVITTSPAFMPSYFTLNTAGEVVINRARLENVGNQLPPHEAHGSFQLNDGAMEALERFYDLTMARKLAGQCGPPRF